MMISQLEDHHLVFTQAAVQLVAWYHIFEYTSWYLRKYCLNCHWFQKWSQKPDEFLGGEKGVDGVIYELRYSLQHTYGGIFMALGYYLSSPQCFITGVLSEFSFEILDTYAIIKQRFITKKGQHSADKVPFWGFVLGMMHHSGAITVMLPACIYYADNVYVQQTALGLLGFASLSLPLQLISSSRDVYDLKERGQFTVAFVVQVVLFVYFRCFVCVQGMYGVVRHEFPSFSWQLTLLFSVYIICIKLFDVLILMVCAQGVHKWLFTAAATKRPTKITKASLKRPTLIPIELIRTQSTPLMC